MTNGYQQFRPSEAFRSLVDAYWINRPDAPRAAGGAPVDRVLPDGCIDLVFRGGANGGALFSSALIERPVFFDGAHQRWYVGVRFRPAMARALLDIDPVECRDRNIPAREIDAGFGVLERALQDCASAEEALAVLKRAIDARLVRREREAAPARALGITERSLYRDMLRWSGLAPKPLARILRLQRTLAALRAGRLPLALIAAHMANAHQAHMNREMKVLAGATPAELAARPVRNLQDAA